MTKIVILDGHVANPGDLSWQAIENQGALTVYKRTPQELIIERAKEADIVLVNKCKLTQPIIRQLPNLKCICLLATGYNNVDTIAAKEQNIVVCNAKGYSGPAVAQHVFSLLLELTNQVGVHNQIVQQNGWATSIDWSFWNNPMVELSGKTMGIYGLGTIGKQVAKIALAFGMKVIAVRKNVNKPTPSSVQLVTLNQLFSQSDVLTLHAPLTAENEGFINQSTLKQMKNTAILINTGRGGLVNETDLRTALLEGQIAGAGLDVLSQEPPPENHILQGIPNCLITPHHAWATRASRARLIEIVAENIRAFLAGQPRNVV